jgi:hypothetical protein
VAAPAGPLVTSACSTIALETEAPSRIPQYVVWIVGGSMLAMAATCWLPLWMAAARTAAANVRVVALQAALDKALVKIRGFSDAQARFVGSLAQEIKAPGAAVGADAAVPGAPAVRVRRRGVPCGAQDPVARGVGVLPATGTARVAAARESRRGGVRAAVRLGAARELHFHALWADGVFACAP